MAADVVLVEVAREAATLLMLLGVAMLAERRPLRRFAAFAFCFGVWDIVYYVMLRAAIGWPASLLEWDILFLIPAPWTSPVLAPVLVSLALIGAAVLILRRIGDATPSPSGRSTGVAGRVRGADAVVVLLERRPGRAHGTAGRLPVVAVPGRLAGRAGGVRRALAQEGGRIAAPTERASRQDDTTPDLQTVGAFTISRARGP